MVHISLTTLYSKKEIFSILEIFRLSYGNATAWSKMFAWAVNSRKVLFDIKKYISRELQFKPVSITVSKISTRRQAGMNGNVTHSTGGNEDLLYAARKVTNFDLKLSLKSKKNQKLFVTQKVLQRQ